MTQVKLERENTQRRGEVKQDRKLTEQHGGHAGQQHPDGTTPASVFAPLVPAIRTGPEA